LPLDRVLELVRAVGLRRRLATTVHDDVAQRDRVPTALKWAVLQLDGVVPRREVTAEGPPRACVQKPDRGVGRIPNLPEDVPYAAPEPAVTGAGTRGARRNIARLRILRPTTLGLLLRTERRQVTRKIEHRLRVVLDLAEADESIRVREEETEAVRHDVDRWNRLAFDVDDIQIAYIIAEHLCFLDDRQHRERARSDDPPRALLGLLRWNRGGQIARGETDPIASVVAVIDHRRDIHNGNRIIAAYVTR